jgi:antitoxin component of RelBE/YafQ-DinJ toxin-antitoxin module
MPSTTRIDIRLTEQEKQQARQQAEQLGLDISGYIKMIIKLDASTNIIKRLKEAE